MNHLYELVGTAIQLITHSAQSTCLQATVLKICQPTHQPGLTTYQF